MLMFSNIHQDEWIRTPGRVQMDIAKREGEIDFRARYAV